MELKRLAIGLVQAAISIAAIALVLARVDFSQFAAHWRELGPGMIAASLALLGFQMTVLAGMRLKLVLQSLGTRLPLRRTAAVALTGFFFEQVALGFAGGDAMRLWLLQRSDVPLKTAIGGVLTDRCLGLATILLLVLLGLPGLLPLVSDVDRQIIVPTVAALAAAGITAVAALAFLPERWRRVPIIGDLSRLLTRAAVTPAVRAPLAAALVLAATTHLLNVLEMGMIGHSLGMPVSPSQWFFIVPAVLLFSMLPISAGGWGLREGAMVIGLQYLGVPAAAAVVPSIVFGLSMLLVTLPGAVVWMASRGSRQEAASPRTAPYRRRSSAAPAPADTPPVAREAVSVAADRE